MSHVNVDAWLKNALEQRMGGIVKERIISIQNMNSSMIDSLVDDMAHSIYLSKEMSEFRNDLLNQDSELLVNGSVAFTSKNATFSGSSVSHQNATFFRSSVDDGSRELKSMEFSPTPVSRGQHVDCCPNDRLQALTLLLKVPISDIVCSANWPQLQQELCESLCDDDWNVFHQVLKVLARLSSSLSHSPVREGFLSLLEGLTLYYLSRHLHQQLPSALHGIHLENSVHRRIILISQCLLQVLYEVPGKWIRYGEKRVAEIVDNCIDLLSMHTHHHRSLSSDQSKDVLYPFHIFSLLDPEAKWCVIIMHAAFGRSILIKCILKSPSLIRYIIEEIIIWLETQMKLSDGVTPVYEFGNSGNINGNMVSLTVFIHCISLLKLFVSCDRGYTIFPVLTSIQEESVSVYAILLKILSYLNKVATDSKRNYSKKLLRNLENVCVSLILCHGTRILQGSSIDLIHLLLAVPHGNDHFYLLSHNIRILCKISESQAAVSWMLGRQTRRTREGVSRNFYGLRASLSSARSPGRDSILTNRASCVARSVAKATSAALKDRNRITSEAALPLCQLLVLSEKLFSTPDGYIVLESCEGLLIALAGNLLIHIRKMMYTSDQGLLSIQKSLESFLMGITQTPLGFLAVSSVEGLLKCIVACNVEGPIIENYNEPRFLHLLQLTTLVPNIKLQQYRETLIKNALNCLWCTQQTDSEWIWQEAINQFSTNVLSICASPRVVSEMWDELEREDNSSESTLVEEVEPLSLKELLSRGLQYAGDDSYPHLQDVSLAVLHSLSHNIDIAVVLQEKLNLIDCLQKSISDTKLKELSTDMLVLPSPRKDKILIFTDENTLRSNHILNIVQELRDTSAADFLPWPRCWCPMSPRSQIRTGRSRAQTDLQRFLQDTRHGLHDNMWVSHARRAYRLSSRTELKVPVLLDLLDQILRVRSSPALAEASFEWPTGAMHPLPSHQHSHAVDMIVRYGCQQKLLSPNMINQHVEQLYLLLHQANIFLNHHGTAQSFDWFVAAVFLMCAGNIDRSRSILQRIAMLPTGALIWPLSSQNSVLQTASINHHLQGILEEYATKAYNSLLGAGVPWWFVTDRLTHQALLPLIPLSQLPHILALTALHSWEYNLYMRTAILVHIEPRLLDMSLHHPTLSLLAELRLDDFFVGDYLPFIDKLAKLSRLHSVRDRTATATL